jgi:threonine/homoserine/homoserine lactone efflux protein
MAIGAVLGFWLVAVLLIVVPGPDWAFTLAAAGHGRVASAVGGLAVGYTALTALVAAGLGALVAGTPAALTGLTVAGGLYLGWLGLRTVRHPGTVGTATPSGRDDRTPGGHTLLRGVAVSGLNPKGLLLFVALLPQFSDPREGWPVAVQLAVLGVVFTVSCAAFYALLGAFAGGVLRARPGAAGALSRTAGAAMALAGAVLLLERLLPALHRRG